MKLIDIGFVGSGVAASVTLIELLNKLLSEPPAAEKLTIAVIEKNQELWKGVPYGSRSSVNALIITSVHDFINENERPLFYEWLKANKDDWASYYCTHGGITAARWLENNMPLIENNDWKTVYIPRFLFGNYLQQKLNGLIKAVEEKKLAEIKIIRAEAIDVKVIAEGVHEITVEHPDATLSKITAHKLVIATGSAPVKKLCEISNDKVVYVNDIYEPSTVENLNTLQTALSNEDDEAKRNVLIIGSNASSIEILYLLEGLPVIRKLINKIIIISPSGILPYFTNTEPLASHPMPNLDKIESKAKYSIEALVDAAAADIRLALRGGANMDYIATIISNTLKLLEVLGEEAKKSFFAIHAIRLRNMFRRAGPEYRNVAQSFLDLQQVKIVKGNFLSMHTSEEGGELTYLDCASGQQQIYPLSFKAIINCTGSDNLDQSSSRLLYNLVNKHICKMNLSGKGFEVNEKFEAAPNLYIMGPLLGGNVNKLIHFWQLENAARLTFLAPHLANELLSA